MDCHDLSPEFSILSIVQSNKKENKFHEIVIIKTFDICWLSAWPSKFNTSKRNRLSMWIACQPVEKGHLLVAFFSY